MKKIFIEILLIIFVIFIAFFFNSKILKYNWVSESPETKYSKKRMEEVWGGPLRGNNPDLFYGTPFYDLANSMSGLIYIRNVKKIERLIDKIPKKYINYKEGYYGMTIGHFALRSNNLNIIPKLLDRGLNPNIISIDGQAIVIDNSNYLYYHPVECFDNLKYMIKKGANVNLYSEKSSLGSTPLINAARCGNLKYFKLLIVAGANPHFIDEKGYYFSKSALGTALAYKHIDIVNYLIFDQKVDFRIFKFPLNSMFHPGEYEILHNLREMFFELNSKKYQEKMKLVAYLKTQGLDYWKTPIQERFSNNPNYTKDYLSKY
jgi:ankyrin repeat protein